MRIRVRSPLPLLAALLLAPLAGAQIPLPKPSPGGVGTPYPGGGAGGTHRGPGDTAPDRGAGNGGGRPSPGPARPGTGGPSSPQPGGPARPGATPAGPLAIPIDLAAHEVGPEEWWTWWQLHKVEFLRPNLMRHWLETVTSIGGGDEHPGAPMQRLRDETAPRLLAQLDAGDPLLRGAAALAYGRVAGAAAIDALLPLLRDPSQHVRERALFALGATGAPRAAEILLRIARTGAPEESGGSPIAHDAEALAVFALAVGRRNGMVADVDLAVAGLTPAAERTGGSLLATSLLLYQTLAPTDALGEWALELANDEDALPMVRCRALETLRLRGDERALDALVAARESGQADVRRSAALALGELQHPLAVSRLIAACDREREPLARGFLLISLGRQGGEEAERYLVDFLARGAKAGHPWAALGLAILARDGSSDDARAALRKALARARSAETRSAVYLALGIARDEASRAELEEALADASAPESRAAAAFGLAMLGGEQSAALLEERLAEDSNPIVRAEIAQALGYMGAKSSVDDLMTALRETPDPWLRASAALALGLHGTRGGLEALLAFSTEEDVQPAVRAAGLEALQLVLGQAPSLTIGELLRQANFAVFPPTLIRLRAIPL